MVILVICIATILIIGAVVFYYVKNKNKNKKEETPVIPTYSLRFVTNCEEKLEDIILKENEIMPKLPTLKKNGYNFKGWYMDENFETPVNKKLEVTEDVTLYAKFEEQSIEEFLTEIDTKNIEKDIIKKVKKSYKEENNNDNL